MIGRMVPSCFFVLALSAGPGAAAPPATPPAPPSNGAVGEWTVKDGTARVAIAPCGENLLCGKIVWIKFTPGRDENNPDPAKRDRSVLGLQILNDMKRAAPERWEGTVYNPQNGKTYTAVLTLKDPDHLRMEGCVMKVLCGGEEWTRFKEPDEAKNDPKAAKTDQKQAKPAAASKSAAEASRSLPAPPR